MCFMQSTCCAHINVNWLDLVLVGFFCTAKIDLAGCYSSINVCERALILELFFSRKELLYLVVSDPPGLSTFTCINMLVNFHIYWSSWNLALLLMYHSLFFKVWIIFSQAWWPMWRWWRWLPRVSNNQANNSSWPLWLSTWFHCISNENPASISSIHKTFKDRFLTYAFSFKGHIFYWLS